MKQYGADVTAAILRVDGDTGALTGTFHDGKWLLSHFDGSRPDLLEVTPAKDGTLAMVRRAEALAPGNLTAYREDVAQAKSLARAGRLHHAHHDEGSQRSVRL